MPDRDLRPETLVVEAGRPPRTPGGPINVPISVSSTYLAGGEITYAREGTDSTRALEAALGAVEGGTAVAFSSGIAATSAVLGAVPAGSPVVVPRSFYQAHHTLLDDSEALGKITVRRVDTDDTDAVVAALTGAALLWLEVPSNPMLRVADLPRLTAAARQAGVLSVVDSTVATPLNLRPLEHGADIVMHSATKWIGGHSDVLSGVLVTRTPVLAEAVLHHRTLAGAQPGTLESFLTLRGLRTLSVRLERAQANARALAARLETHPRVEVVHYPGLASHPDAARVKALLDGPGALVSFEPKGGAEAAERVCRRVKLMTNATSLGGVESLIEHRGRYPGEAAQNTPAGLVRLSVGIEHVEDLWTDLESALSAR